jgi:hypothetical protein
MPCLHLLVGPSDDAHSVVLIEALRERGCTVTWVQGDRPLPVLQELIDPATMANPVSVVYRRATAAAHADPGVEDYLTTEVGEYVYALGALTPDWHWFPSAPLTVRTAGIKPLQLHLAHEVGLRTPTTYVGSDTSRLRALGVGAGWVAKPLRAQHVVVEGRHRWLGTVHLDDLPDSEQLAPAIHQPRLDIADEVRVVVVDDEVRGFRVCPPTDDYADLKDLVGRCTHVPAEVPRSVADGLRALLTRLSTRFASSDFIVTTDGDWVFLELNPNGQWYFLQQDTGTDLLGLVIEALHR